MDRQRPPSSTKLLVGDSPTVRVKHPIRIISAIALLAILTRLLVSVFSNPRFQWADVRHYLFAEPILDGVVITIQLTLIAMIGGIVLGCVLAIMGLSANPVLRVVSNSYLWLFRGVPLLVQILFWYNLAALYPTFNIGIGKISSDFGIDVNETITPYIAALLALALNEAAYMAEIVRSGIQSVDEGQTEAATALGLSGRQTMAKVVLPQAMRVILPPTGNQFIGMLKATSMVSFVAVADLLYAAQLIYTANYKTIPLLIVVSIWYLVLTSVLTLGQRNLERRFGRGSSRHTQPSRRLNKRRLAKITAQQEAR